MAHCARRAGGGLAPAPVAATRAKPTAAPSSTSSPSGLGGGDLPLSPLSLAARLGQARRPSRKRQLKEPDPRERIARLEELVGVRQILRRGGDCRCCPHSWSQRWGSSGKRGNFEDSGSRGARAASFRRLWGLSPNVSGGRVCETAWAPAPQRGSSLQLRPRRGRAG